MTVRPGPGGLPGDAEFLLELDAFLDRLAGLPLRGAAPGGPAAELPEDLAASLAELEVLAERLADLPTPTWDATVPLYRGAAAPRGHRRARPSRPRTHTGRLGRRVHRRALEAIVTIAAVVAVLVIVLVAISGQPSRRTVSVPPVPSPWRLAGFIEQPLWSEAPSAGALGPQVAVSCATPAACAADDPSGGAAGSVVEVTADGGSSRSTSALPAGTWLTTDIDCQTATSCAVGGYAGVPPGATVPAGATPALFMTANGGTSWTSSALPSVVAQARAVSCASASTCVVLAVGPTPATGSLPEGLALRTSDAGVIWSAFSLPAPFGPEIGGLACATTSSCVAVGVATVPTSTAAGTGAVRFTTDGGATWSSGTLPPGVAAVRSVACPTATQCVALANGPTVAGGSVPGPYGPSEVLATSDGGRTWRLLGTPLSGAELLYSVSCATTSLCVAAGQRLTTSTGTWTGTVVATADGGATWTVATLPTTLTPAQRQATGLTSLEVQNLTSVACPSDQNCIAVGAQAIAGSARPAQVVLRTGG